MKYVKQQQKYGCVFACLAMILEVDYWTVRNEFPKERFGKVLGVDEGISVDFNGLSYLFEKGFVGFTKYKNISYSQTMRSDDDFIKPFAPIHIVSLELNGYSHACVMIDGKIYDPYREGIYKISDYEKINTITGFWKIKDLES